MSAIMIVRPPRQAVLVRHTIAIEEDKVSSGEVGEIFWLSSLPGLVASHNAIKLCQHQAQHSP